MKILEIFPTKILGVVLNDIKDKEIEEYIKYIKSSPLENENKNGKYTKTPNIVLDPLFIKLKSNILKYSNEYLKNTKHYLQEIQISNSWGNIINSNESISAHTHSNSYLSGAFYLSKENSNIQFVSPIKNKFTFNLDMPFPDDFYNITPLKKLLLIFPSWLAHEVLSSSFNDRISIAFNIAPKGEIGGFTNRLKL
jgi:uncharacterized protein (TIGR02466 family)